MWKLSAAMDTPDAKLTYVLDSCTMTDYFGDPAVCDVTNDDKDARIPNVGPETLVAKPDVEGGPFIIFDPREHAYPPFAGANSDYAIVYHVEDEHGAVSQQQVLTALTRTNNVPWCAVHAIEVGNGETYQGVLPGTDNDGDPLTFTLVDSGVHGAQIVIEPDTGNVTYTPDIPFSGGADIFTYQIDDGNSGTRECEVTVNISPTTCTDCCRERDVNNDGTGFAWGEQLFRRFCYA